MPHPRAAQTRPLHARFAAFVALAIAAVLLPATASPPAYADHTAAPDAVTLVGSLQSELGCADDWQPGCEQTQLTRQDDGTWAATFDVPKGSYEFKVALNRSWDESYGTAGGGNLPLVLQHDARLTFSYDHASHSVGVAPAELPSSDVTAADRAMARVSLRSPLTRERFYFVMADRFANGNSGNNRGGLTGTRLETGYDPTDPGFFHGGDLKGLTNRLDYIEGLGTTAIWLTPSFKNRPVQGSGADASAGYHGYWVTDFTRIDPHFGTNAELKAFIAKAHRRGIKVFFDIITNHTADVIDYAEGRYTYIPKADEPYRDAGGQAFDDRDYAGTDTFPELDPETSFPYTPTFRSEADKTVKVPAWLNDPTNYHNRGDSTFAGESSTYGDFVGLDDLFTEQPDVVDGMSEIYKTWVDFGIDGFRIDTVKHVNLEFWQQFAPAIRAEANRIGNRDFFAFGEVYDADPALMSTYTTKGRLDATLDFGFQAAGTNFAKGSATTKLRDFYAGDDYYTDIDSNAYALPTFLGNHDMGRIGSFLQGNGQVLQRDRLAHSLMYLTRGQPVVYYGDEQGFTGDGGDKAARQDMFASKVASYNDDDLIGTSATTAQANFDTSHPMYRMIKRLAALRAAYPALADGAQLHRYASNDAGVYAFSRIGSGEKREFVVAVNNATTAKTVTFGTEMRRTNFRKVWPSTTGAIRSDGEQRVTVTVPPLSAVVYRANQPLAKRTAAPAVQLQSPTAGGTVGDRAPITAAVPEGGFNQVTVAWRPVGGTTWTKLGTDDNAPYRVYHDVSGLPDGTMVEYRAILRDSSGNFSASSTYATVGEATADPGTPGGGGGTGPVTQPDAVSMPGSHNSEIGCPGDWQPDCDQAQLALDANDLVWKKTATIPAGDYEYKAAINKSWDENYGAGGAPGGSNIPLELGAPKDVTFYYSHATHWITSDAQDPIITIPGSFQDELGCSGDWDPACMRSWLQDPDGDGTYTFTTDALPAGTYEGKVAHGLSWTENYGQGGARDGANYSFDVSAAGVQVVFSYDLASHVLTISTRAAGAAPDLTKQKAHWVERGLIAWDVPDADTRRYRLHWSKAGDLAVDAEAITGGSSVPLRLDPAGLPADVLAKHPQLEGFEAFRLRTMDLGKVPEILTGQLAVASYNPDGTLHDATGVQIPGVLDDVYAAAQGRRLGVRFNPGGAPVFAVWAPTAQSVRLRVEPTRGNPTTVDMRRTEDGTWVRQGPARWRNAAYRYAVKVWQPAVQRVVTNRVTDPYSVGLTANSTRSLAIDLRAPGLKPDGWDALRPPRIAQPEDRNVYELHIRDFSIGDETVPAAQRGTYLAFAQNGTGMRHLRALSRAGLNTVHLLPAFDIATIPERRADQLRPQCDLASMPPDSEQQQACIEEIRAKDGFNWGYDPFHYTVPEGSYSTNPDGPARTKQFRRMVSSLNGAAMQVVMDVVYNHTASHGQAATSVLDKVVPGYYQRLNATGGVENSTCCSNTAAEHAMMEKLLIDSVLTWAREYKVNGFRFDLMGHHPKSTMVKLRERLDALTVAKDGVDGKGIYLYGEGWNFGEVADDTLFEQATQLNLAGTGIGSFSDRLRDAVRGGGPFDEDPRKQGFGTGLFTDPNGAATNGSPDEQRSALLHDMDLIKLGLAGNLADFNFRNSTGQTVKGSEVDYNGAPAGYAADPSETVTYVDAHDNETLYDTSVMKLPRATSMADRVRMNTVSLSTVALGQGVVFWHAGNDLLRSKSLDRNSYDSGDWFNRIDWTGTENTFGSGLPLKADNEAKWEYMRPLLGDPVLKPGPEAMRTATARAQDLLRMRMSTPLFRLGSAQQIQEKVSFLDSEPGVIAMLIDDTAGSDADSALDGVLVVINATPSGSTVSATGSGWALHEVQAGGTDEVVKGSTVASDSVTVPARTAAVFTR